MTPYGSYLKVTKIRSGEHVVAAYVAQPSPGFFVLRSQGAFQSRDAALDHCLALTLNEGFSVNDALARELHEHSLKRVVAFPGNGRPA